MNTWTLDNLLKYLVKNDGSDLHLTVGAKPRIRVSGILRDITGSEVLVSREVEQLVFPILDTRERAIVNSTGQYDLAYFIRGLGRFRVNIFRQKGDVTAVFRLLNDKSINIRELGIPQKILNLYQERRGMVLVVGPTGSGKTTTLTGLISLINAELPKHILTLEDPVEYLHWHDKSIVNQREIGSDCDTFANGLRAALREDPDVILVGEIRDGETAEIALTAAETGHLLLSTLHTLGSAETLNRLVNMFPADKINQARLQIADTLLAVVSQQLLPRKDGGRIVAFETLFVSNTVKDLIRDNDTKGIREYMTSEEGIEDGCITMDNSILKLYNTGLITGETAISYALNRKEMQKYIR